MQPNTEICDPNSFRSLAGSAGDSYAPIRSALCTAPHTSVRGVDRPISADLVGYCFRYFFLFCCFSFFLLSVFFSPFSFQLIFSFSFATFLKCSDLIFLFKF
jgi:hypothetical protein